MRSTLISTTTHRIDVRRSERRVRVVVAGEVIADTRRPLVLEETGCPTRWYLPREDVRVDRLERSATRTHCPYKGDATYWTVRVGDRVVPDAAWSYEDPLLERADIRGLFCFYGSRVDGLEVEGEPAPRP